MKSIKVVYIYSVICANEDAPRDKPRKYWRFKVPGAKAVSELYTRRWSAARGAKRRIPGCTIIYAVGRPE